MSTAKHNPAPWEYENVEQPHDKSAYGVVKDANGKILFDTLNSDVAEIHTEYDGEDGSVHRWDEAGRVNLAIAAAAPELLAICYLALNSFCDPHAVAIDPAAARLEVLCKAAIAKVS